MSPRRSRRVPSKLTIEPGAVGDMFADSMDRQIDSILDPSKCWSEYVLQIGRNIKSPIQLLVHDGI